MTAEIGVEAPGRRAELRVGGRAARLGHSGASAPGGSGRADPGCRVLLGACKALCNRLNPAVVYPEPSEV